MATRSFGLMVAVLAMGTLVGCGDEADGPTEAVGRGEDGALGGSSVGGGSVDTGGSVSAAAGAPGAIDESGAVGGAATGGATPGAGGSAPGVGGALATGGQGGEATVSPCGACAAPTPVCDPESSQCVACLDGTHCSAGQACDSAARTCRAVVACDRCVTDADCGGTFTCYGLSAQGERGLCVHDGTSCQAGDYCCTIDLDPPGVPDGYTSSSCNPNFTCSMPSGDASRDGPSSGDGGGSDEPGALCSQPLTPATGLVADFSTVDPTALTWTNESGLSGAIVDVGFEAVRYDLSQGKLSVAGELEYFFGGYGLVMLVLDQCIDASSFSGISFSVAGAIGTGSTISVNVNTAATTPVADGGLCQGDYGAGCAPPAADFELSGEPATISLAWSDLVGEPSGPTDPAGITAIVWTISNPDAAPSVALTIDDVTFW